MDAWLEALIEWQERETRIYADQTDTAADRPCDLACDLMVRRLHGIFGDDWAALARIHFGDLWHRSFWPTASSVETERAAARQQYTH